jgi:hypothetical protein
MQKYLMVCGHELVDKNKLDAALKAWFRKEDRRVFESEDEIKRFVAETKAVCELENPRCKEIEVYVEIRTQNKKDLIVRGGMGLNVDFFAFEIEDRSIQKKHQYKALEVITENFLIHSVEVYQLYEDEAGQFLSLISVKYRFFGKLCEGIYNARTLKMGLDYSIIELTSDSDIHDSLKSQIEVNEEMILVFLNAWVKAYNEGLAEDEKN